MLLQEIMVEDFTIMVVFGRAFTLKTVRLSGPLKDAIETKWLALRQDFIKVLLMLLRQDLVQVGLGLCVCIQMDSVGV